jgi:hypothetical protein
MTCKEYTTGEWWKYRTHATTLLPLVWYAPPSNMTKFAPAAMAALLLSRFSRQNHRVRSIHLQGSLPPINTITPLLNQIHRFTSIEIMLTDKSDIDAFHRHVFDSLDTTVLEEIHRKADRCRRSESSNF